MRALRSGQAPAGAAPADCRRSAPASLASSSVKPFAPQRETAARQQQHRPCSSGILCQAMPESPSSLQQASTHLTMAQGVMGERRKLKQALKSTRKRLEQCILPSMHHAHQQRVVTTTAATAATPAVCPSSADALIEDLLARLRSLDSSRLSALQEPAVLDHLLAASDSDSDEEDDCRAVSMATAACAPPPAAVQSLPALPTPVPVSSSGSSAVRQGVLGGAVELAVPEPLQGWDSDAFAEMQFAGAGRVLVCQGSKCQARGGLDVLRAVSELASGSPGIEVVPCKCVGKCKQGPAMRLRPQEAPCAVYTEIVPQRLPEIFAAHFRAPPPVACDHATGAACCVECNPGHVHQQQGPEAQVPALAVA